MKKEKAGQQGHVPAGSQHQPVPRTDRGGHKAKNGEHKVLMAALGSSACPGQPWWRWGVTWGPRFVLSRLDQHVLVTEQPQGSRNRRGLRRPRCRGV